MLFNLEDGFRKDLSAEQDSCLKESPLCAVLTVFLEIRWEREMPVMTFSWVYSTWLKNKYDKKWHKISFQSEGQTCVLRNGIVFTLSDFSCLSGLQASLCVFASFFWRPEKWAVLQMWHRFLCLLYCLLHDINIWWIVRQIVNSEDSKSKGIVTKVTQYETGWTPPPHEWKREKLVKIWKLLESLEKNNGLVLAYVKAFS